MVHTLCTIARKRLDQPIHLNRDAVCAALVSGVPAGASTDSSIASLLVRLVTELSLPFPPAPRNPGETGGIGLSRHFETISSSIVPGFTLGHFWPAAGGIMSAAGRYSVCVFRSSAIVRALFFVETFSATEYLSGESSCTTVNVPLSPFDENARLVPGSNAAASAPSPVLGVAITFPESASTTAIISLSQTAKSRRVFVSIASPDGSLHGASGQRCSTVIFCASICSSSLVSSTFTYTLPFPSAAANSGLPPTANVLKTFPSAASITVASLLRPLNANTRLVTRSYKIASGFVPAGTVLIVFSVFRSKMVTELARPLLTNPRPSSGASAIPCTPCVSGISPTTA